MFAKIYISDASEDATLDERIDERKWSLVELSGRKRGCRWHDKATVAHSSLIS